MSDVSPEVQALLDENRRLREALDARTRVTARALAGYQQQVLQMETIRQQNEDLDRLALDLSRAKQIAEERARESEAAARLQREFLANFSHEIRTPLNGILGYCDLLLREEGDRLTPLGRRDLNVVKANARTLLSLINDILDLSKIEAGHVEVIQEQFDLRPLLDECTATVRQLLKGKEIELASKVHRGAEQLFTDVLKVRQILLNLLTNAAKFTEAGEIVVTASANGNTLVLSVEDTGTGIPADQLDKIFEKFRQVDGSATRRVGGTGLGLAIVRQLSKLLGGQVEVVSVYGRGSTFTVTLPDTVTTPVEAPATRKTEKREERETTERATILLIDDDPVLQRLVRGHLEAEGFQVVVATDGVEALAAAREFQPDTAILDIHLPVLDGWSVLTQLKSDPALSAIHVIILSVEDDRKRGFSLGACDYLLKPVEPEQLVAVVRRSVTPASGEVLIVDDDAATRELVARSLRRVGFSTADAESGDEALVRIRVNPPALLVLDLLMPRVDGFEVIRQMRSEGRTTPVVVLTGKVLTAEEERTLRAGFVQIVTKGGFAIDQVVCEAKRALVQRRTVEAKRLPRVLYIEDSAQNRDLVRRYLVGQYELVEAEDGEQGLERVTAARPDVVLMDLSLPRLDGWQTTRRIKENPALGTIPVIAVSAHASREDVARARDAGCVEYLTKPVSYDDLIAALQRHVKSKALHG